jgi:hypothetical protein
MKVLSRLIPSGERSALFLASVLIVLCCGCASMVPKPEISATRSLGADLGKLKKFYIAYDKEPNERHARTLRAVQTSLASRGTAGMGMPSGMPPDTECKVVVRDHWFWDLQWYQLKLEISLFDPHTGALLGSGSSQRADPSLRRGPEFMANEVLDAIYRAPELPKNL